MHGMTCRKDESKAIIGRIISHYRNLEALERGDMGVVNRAEDTNLKRGVAVKFLPRTVADSSMECERFTIEAQAAASLNHPNIATIYTILTCLMLEWSRH